LRRRNRKKILQFIAVLQSISASGVIIHPLLLLLPQNKNVIAVAASDII
jgi:hypothetical protein